MTLSVYLLDLSLIKSDTFLLIATICTLALLLIAYRLKNQHSSSTSDRASHAPNTTEPTVQAKPLIRNGSGDAPRHSSGRRRRREDHFTASGNCKSQPAASRTPSVRTPITPVVDSIRKELKAKNRSPSTEIHGRSKPVPPGTVARTTLLSPSSKPDEVSNSKSKVRGTTPKRQVLEKQSIESIQEVEKVEPSAKFIPRSSKQEVSANMVTVDVTETSGEWRDVTPRRKERRRSRQSSKQSESGTPVPPISRDSLSGTSPNSVPAVAGSHVELQQLGPVETAELAQVPTPERIPTPVLKAPLEKEVNLQLTEDTTEQEQVDELTAPSPTIEDTKPSKTSKPRRKRRSGTAKSSVSTEQATVAPVPETLSVFPEPSVVQPDVDPPRMTPDDSEFELIEMVGHPSNSVTESDQDPSLDADWSLAQPIPSTRDSHEFPHLPGTESLFAIVHPSGIDANLECGQHPQARHLLNSALNDPVDDDVSHSGSITLSGLMIPSTTSCAPPTKPVVKRSKVRKAD